MFINVAKIVEVPATVCTVKKPVILGVEQNLFRRFPSFVGRDDPARRFRNFVS